MENEIKKMPKGHYIFLWGGLIKDAGGMTRVMLDRVCGFKREGLHVTVLLGGRGKEQYDAVEIYKNAGYPEICKEDFLCMEDWLANRLTTNQNIKDSKEQEGFFLSKRSGNTQDIYSNGVLSGKRYYGENNSIVKVENYAISSGEKKKIESIEYYYNNKKYKTTIIANQLEKYESYYADNGFCFMTCYFYEGKEKTVRLFNQNDGSVVEYANISDVREYFYSQYVMENYNEDLFVICDPILDFEPGFRYMKEVGEHKIYKIAINHGIGFAIPRNWNSKCNPRFQRYLDTPSSELDALIILTEVALKNIKKRFGDRNIFKCIPNKVDLNPVRRPIEKRNKNKTVFVGRFSEEKQCVQVVKAFALVVKQYPNAILELYGRGNSEDSIREEIEKNGLTKNVFVKGFSRNVQDVFSDARLSVVASEYTFESFCLSLVESLASGCPAVSYEMKFGAGYVIKDGYNGFLTKADDIEKLAENIIKVYNMDDAELEKLSINAYETAKIFSPESYEENWRKLLDDVIEQKKTKTAISKMEVTISNIICSTNPAIKTLVQGNIKVIGQIGENAEKFVKLYARNYTKDKDDYVRTQGKYTKESEGVYTFEIEIDNVNNPISICFECTNSFLETEVTNEIRAALKI